MDSAENRNPDLGTDRLLTLTLSSVEEQRETGWGVSPDVWMRLEVRSPRR